MSCKQQTKTASQFNKVLLLNNTISASRGCFRGNFRNSLEKYNIKPSLIQKSFRTNLYINLNSSKPKNKNNNINNNNNNNSKNSINKNFTSNNVNILNITDTLNKYKFADPNLVRFSHKNFGVFKAYAAITCNGRRNYNEDRVSIIYNIPKPEQFEENPLNKGIKWPKCSFFGIYDGHGGSGASNFLRDNLHKFIVNNRHFPSNVQKAIVEGINLCERSFFSTNPRDFSGSCALLVISVNNTIYISNVGDSRALLSSRCGKRIYALSHDHRPTSQSEYKRIIEAGGKIYKTEYSSEDTSLIGPLRVFPGRLSVSRTLGDAPAKLRELGGNPAVVISTPEIKYFENNSGNDFILIGCDGIFEKLKNKEIIDYIWNQINNSNYKDIHNLAGSCVEEVIHECLDNDSCDNLTVIMLCLKDLEEMKNSLDTYQEFQTENIEKNKKVKENLIRDKNKTLQVLLGKFKNNKQNKSNSVEKNK